MQAAECMHARGGGRSTSAPLGLPMGSEAYLWWQPRASPGFDGWLQLVRETFETEDQAIEGEKSRLRAIGRAKRRALEARGVHVDYLRLRFECGLVWSPPEAGEERVWAIDHFKDRLLAYVDSDAQLAARLLQHQSAVHGLANNILSDRTCEEKGAALGA